MGHKHVRWRLILNITVPCGAGRVAPARAASGRSTNTAQRPLIPEIDPVKFLQSLLDDSPEGNTLAGALANDGELPTAGCAQCLC
jgi:hypothetical protein